MQIHSGELQVSLDILNKSDLSGPYILARSVQLFSSEDIQLARPFDLLVENSHGQIRTVGTCSLVTANVLLNETEYLASIYKTDKKTINPLKLFGVLLITSFGILLVLFVIFTLYKQRKTRAASEPQQLVEIPEPSVQTNASPDIDVSQVNDIPGGNDLEDQQVEESPREQLEALHEG